MRTLSCLALLLQFSFATMSAPAFAQAAIASPDPTQPRFEVASIRHTPSGPTIVNAIRTFPGGRILAKGSTVEFLLMEAFNLQEFQITNVPAWAKETRFDIQAKPSDAIAAKYKSVPSPKDSPTDEQRRMLQSLLIERFHLITHLAKTTGPIFVLTKNGHSLRFEPSKDPAAFHWAGGMGGGLPDGDGIRGVNISMPEFATRLSSWMKRPVEDHTGLTGSYDFEAKYGDEDSPTEDDITTSIFTSLKSLGLELKQGTGAVRQLVVDQVSAPTEN